MTSTVPTDAELIANIRRATEQETTQTQKNRFTAKFIAVRVALPLAVTAGVVIVLNRLNKTEETTEETTEQ